MGADDTPEPVTPEAVIPSNWAPYVPGSCVTSYDYYHFLHQREDYCCGRTIPVPIPSRDAVFQAMCDWFNGPLTDGRMRLESRFQENMVAVFDALRYMVDNLPSAPRGGVNNGNQAWALAMYRFCVAFNDADRAGVMSPPKPPKPPTTNELAVAYASMVGLDVLTTIECAIAKDPLMDDNRVAALCGKDRTTVWRAKPGTDLARIREFAEEQRQKASRYRGRGKDDYSDPDDPAD